MKALFVAILESIRSAVSSATEMTMDAGERAAIEMNRQEIDQAPSSLSTIMGHQNDGGHDAGAIDHHNIGMGDGFGL